tara:strand:- start:113 stop:376 length:264 start_codon:yes stop_codon:yes gene_type:complete
MGFGIDMSKAKDIHRNNIRSSRKNKLAELDVEFQKAQETSSDTSAIVAKKQVLRDYPARAGIATAANTTELKADWDTTILGDKPKGY